MIIFGADPISIEQIVAIAESRCETSVDSGEGYRKQIERGASFLDTLLAEEGVIYGVTTGYGDSCTTAIPSALVKDLPHQLLTFHGCGLGDYFNETAGRAIVAARLTSLAKGYSGVSYPLLQRLNQLLELGVIPVVPEEGSVGASGDLTPLSYVAAVLCGQRSVYYQGRVQSAQSVFQSLGIEPLVLRPKEGLALMNGTAVMTALACLAFKRTQYLTQLTTRITALMVVAAQGNAHHFDELLFNVKPHPGQQAVAAQLRSDLHAGEPPRNPNRLQDRYSLRCAPHVIGVLADSETWWRQFIENELNSANDNPIVDGEGEHVLHGGHFYGGHICAVMDSMKTGVANLADLLDRQVAQLVDVKFNHGLPANLSGADTDQQAINHGFKAVQIGCSAWAAEALKHTMPASVFSRSTECHNQDKVSMGTIAARDCLRVLQLTEQVAAAALLAAVQGVELRRALADNQSELGASIQTTVNEVRALSEPLANDRALEADLRGIVSAIQQRKFGVYSAFS